MSKYTALEKQVLKDLDITSFRGTIPKEKLIKISSSLHKLDPEVCKKLIEQFPAYKDGLCDIVLNYKEIANKALNESSDSSKTFYEAKLREIDILENELNKDYLSNDERFAILDKISQVTQSIDDKDTELHNFAINVIKAVGTVVFAVSLGMFTALGNSLIKKNNFENDEED